MEGGGGGRMLFKFLSDCDCYYVDMTMNLIFIFDVIVIYVCGITVNLNWVGWAEGGGNNFSK